MQDKNVKTLVVGIGRKVYPEELKKIAGTNVYLVDNFDQLLDHIKQIEELMCSKFIYTLVEIDQQGAQILSFATELLLHDNKDSLTQESITRSVHLPY